MWHTFIFSVCPSNQNGFGCSFCKEGLFGKPYEWHGFMSSCQECSALNCKCKENYNGPYCNDCLQGFYGFHCADGISIKDPSSLFTSFYVKLWFLTLKAADCTVPRMVQSWIYGEKIAISFEL